MFYSFVYQNIAFPLHEIIRGRKTHLYLRRLEESQWKPLWEIQSRQWRALQSLLHYSYQRVPFYRQLFDSLAITPDRIRCPEDFQQLPILTKEIIRENRSRLVSPHYRGKNIVKSTSGSTGAPFEFEHSIDSWCWRTAAAMRGYSWAGAFEGVRHVYFWRPPLKPLGRVAEAKQTLHRFFQRQKFIDCFDLTREGFARCIEEINRFRPVSIIGFAMPLYALSKFILDTGAAVHRPASIISAAERLYPQQRETIERALGAPVFNTYGSREFMLIAAECERHEGLHLSAENLYVEVIKDGRPAGPGEVGDIVITDLHNYGMPFIRYPVGDLALATAHQCSCGRGLPLIADVVGRTLELIATPQGRLLPGQFFTGMMMHLSDIKEFQVIQESLHELVIKLVPGNGSISEWTLKKIRNQVEQAFGQQVRLDLQIVSDIPRSKAGKFLITQSKVTAALSLSAFAEQRKER